MTITIEEIRIFLVGAAVGLGFGWIVAGLWFMSLYYVEPVNDDYE